MDPVIETLQSLGKLAQALRANFLALYSIFVKPREFFGSLKYETTDALVQASIFAAFVIVLSFFIGLPADLSIGVDSWQARLLLAEVVATYGVFFLGGAILHGSARLFGGKGAFQGTVITFLYLRAFVPVITLVQLPAQQVVTKLIVENPEAEPLTMPWTVAPALSASRGTFARAALSIVVWLVYLGYSTRAYRRLHRLGRARGVALTVLGEVGYRMAVLVVLGPFEHMRLRKS